MSNSVCVTVVGADLCFPTIPPGKFIIDGFSSGALSGYICVSNAHQVSLPAVEKKFRDVLNSGTCIPDSKVLKRYASLLDSRVSSTQVLRGAELVIDTCKYACRDNIPVGFYGGTDKIVSDLVANITHRFPELDVKYFSSPPFSDEDEELDQAVRQIRASGAQILFVGLGCPKQEYWMKRNSSVADNLLMIGVGAAFDFIAGAKRASPEWVHRYSLDWLYRLAIEPRRLWKRYLFFNSLFILLALKQLATRCLGRQEVQ